MRGLPQSVHIIDRQKSVFVHGIAVIRIPNHQRVNPVKLRDQHLQYAKRVHGSQRMCRVRPQQYFAQRVPKIRALRDVNRQRGQRVGDAVFSGLRKHVPMRGHQREDAQNRAGVVELRPRNNVDAPLVEQEVGPGNRRAPPAKLLVKAHRRGQMFHQQSRPAIDDPRMAIICPHPVSRIGRAARFQADRLRCRFVL